MNLYLLLVLFDLINSVNSVFDNFESLPDNNKKDIHLYRDSRFDENKNRLILEATITCPLIPKRCPPVNKPLIHKPF